MSFAGLIIAGIHFNFQLFCQWLTEADFRGWHIKPFWPKCLCLRYDNLGEGLQRRKLGLSNFISRAFLFFSSLLLCQTACLSLNTGAFSAHSWRLRKEKGWALFSVRGPCHYSLLRFRSIRKRSHQTGRRDQVHHRASPTLIHTRSSTGIRNITLRRCVSDQTKQALLPFTCLPIYLISLRRLKGGR